MLEYNGNTYELKYSIKRIEIIENAMKKPLMSVILKGQLSITELKCMIAYAAKKEGADAFMNPKVGMEMVEHLLEEPGGYVKLSEYVAECIERDCPFFFQAG